MKEYPNYKTLNVRYSSSALDNTLVKHNIGWIKPWGTHFVFKITWTSPRNKNVYHYIETNLKNLHEINNIFMLIYDISYPKTNE